jgi:hypothetical protein
MGSAGENVAWPPSLATTAQPSAPWTNAAMPRPVPGPITQMGSSGRNSTAADRLALAVRQRRRRARDGGEIVHHQQ